MRFNIVNSMIVTALIVMIVSLAACSWDDNVHTSRYSPIEKHAMDSLDAGWSDTYIDPLVMSLKAREDSSDIPEHPFGDMIPLVKTLQKRFEAHFAYCKAKKSEEGNYKCYGNHHSFKTLLSDEDIEFLFGKSAKPVQVAAPAVKEEVPATEEAVQQEYVEIEQIEKLIEEADGCKGATNLMRVKLRSGNPLTVADRGEIVNEITYCKTVELMNKVK